MQFTVQVRSGGTLGVAIGDANAVMGRALAKFRTDVGRIVRPGPSERLKLLQEAGRIVQMSCRVAVISGGWGAQRVYGRTGTGQYGLLPASRTAAFQPMTYPSRAGKVPLRGTGKLANSIRYYTAEGAIVLRSQHPGAAVHQYGETIKPGAKGYLLLPDIPPLTEAQARHPGKGSRPRIPGADFRFKPEFKRWSEWGIFKDGVRHIAITDRPVKIPDRPYLGFSERAKAHVVTAAKRVALDLAEKAGWRRKA